MNASRERVIKTLAYETPDRLPVFFAPCAAGFHTHGRKLYDLFADYPCDNPKLFDNIPTPEPGTLDAQGNYHAIKKDAWGTTWEYRIFGVHGHPYAYPFPNWEAARQYAFPAILQPGTPAFSARQAEVSRQTKDHFVVDGWVSLFERLHGLYPMESLLMDLIDRDPALLAFIDRLAAYWQQVVRSLLAAGVDAVMIGDDWCTQTGPMVPRDLFRDLFAPHYAALIATVRAAGRRVFFHMCGRPGYMLEELESLGVDLIWPQIKCYEPHATFARRLKDHRTSAYLHPDRQHLVPRGTPAEIERAVARYAEIHHKLGGGAIFWIEMENDAPWQNVVALVKAVEKYR